MLAIAALLAWWLTSRRAEENAGVVVESPPGSEGTRQPRVRDRTSSTPDVQPAGATAPVRRLRLVYADDRSPVRARLVGVMDALPADRTDREIASDGAEFIDVSWAEAQVLYELRATLPELAVPVRQVVQFGAGGQDVEVAVPRRDVVRVGVQSAAGGPVAEARVLVRVVVGEDEEIFEATADGVGDAIVAVTPGASQLGVAASRAGFIPAVGTVERTGAGKAEGAVILAPGLEVRGTLRSRTGEPVSGARVKILTIRRRAARDAPPALTLGWMAAHLGISVTEAYRYGAAELREIVSAGGTVESDGRFSGLVPVLPSERLIVAVFGPGAHRAWRIVEGPHLAGGPAIDIGEVLTGPADAALRVRFLDTDGAPIANADVHLLPDGVPQGEFDIAAGRTDAAGWLETRAVEAGVVCRVTARAQVAGAAPGMPWVAARVTLEPDRVVTLPRFDPEAPEWR